MTTPTRHVLFVCTHNSARSIMAEGILRALGRGRFEAHSAGSHPAGEVHPMALHTLRAMHLPDDGYRSKDWAEFAQPGAPALDFVLTVCDKAAGEVCLVWPGQPMPPTGAWPTRPRSRAAPRSPSGCSGTPPPCSSVASN